MILLDTDHLNALKYPTSPRYVTLTTKLFINQELSQGTVIKASLYGIKA